MHIIKSLFILLGMCSFLSAQSITITYEATTHTISETVRQAMPELADKKVSYKYELSIKNGLSRYDRKSVFIANKIPSDYEEFWPSETIYKVYNKDLWIEVSGKYIEGHALQKKHFFIVEKQ